MTWTVEYLKEAVKDLRKLDPHTRKLILKAIKKTAVNPLPHPEGYGKPLGNHSSSKLSGYYKIKLQALGYRVVYGLIREENKMRIIIIALREDETIYREAEQRISGLIKKNE